MKPNTEDDEEPKKRLIVFFMVESLFLKAS
jgi:hypothetical protein